MCPPLPPPPRTRPSLPFASFIRAARTTPVVLRLLFRHHLSGSNRRDSHIRALDRVREKALGLLGY